MKYLGLQDPNDLLNGKVTARPHDTFISESDDRKGFAAFAVTSDFPDARDPRKNFRFIKSGLRQTCIDAAMAAAEDPCEGRTIWNSDGTDGPCLICPP